MKFEHRALTPKQKEALAIGATLGRLLIAQKMVKNIEKRQSIATSLGIFLAADLADGVIARQFDVDTPLRRFADAAVDRVSVFRVGWAMSQVYPATQPYFKLLAARDVIVSASNAVHYWRTGEVTKGDGLHKAGSLSIAGFALCASTGNEFLTNISGIASTALYSGLALDYIANAIEPHGFIADGVRHIKPNFPLSTFKPKS